MTLWPRYFCSDNTVKYLYLHVIKFLHQTRKQTIKLKKTKYKISTNHSNPNWKADEIKQSDLHLETITAFCVQWKREGQIHTIWNEVSYLLIRSKIPRCIGKNPPSALFQRNPMTDPAGEYCKHFLLHFNIYSLSRKSLYSFYKIS